LNLQKVEPQIRALPPFSFYENRGSLIPRFFFALSGLTPQRTRRTQKKDKEGGRELMASGMNLSERNARIGGIVI
jgi:hypothetical protein